MGPWSTRRQERATIASPQGKMITVCSLTISTMNYYYYCLSVCLCLPCRTWSKHITMKYACSSLLWISCLVCRPRPPYSEQPFQPRECSIIRPLPETWRLWLNEIMVHCTEGPRSRSRHAIQGTSVIICFALLDRHWTVRWIGDFLNREGRCFTTY